MFQEYGDTEIARDFVKREDVDDGFVDTHVKKLMEIHSDYVHSTDLVTLSLPNPIVESLAEIMEEVDEEDIPDFTEDTKTSSSLSKCYVAAAGYMHVLLSHDADPAVRTMVAYQSGNLKDLMEDEDGYVRNTAIMMYGFGVENQWLRHPITIISDPNRLLVSNSDGGFYHPKNSPAAPQWLVDSIYHCRTPEGHLALSIATERGILPEL